MIGPAPVFVAPGTTEATLSVLDSGAVVTVLAGDIEWCRIEFEGNPGGQVGYVHRSNLAPPVEIYRMEPIDLSIRDVRRPSPLMPIDLSIPVRK